MFKSPSAPAMAPPAAPPPPPNPPMFGGTPSKRPSGGPGGGTAFNASVLGTLPKDTASPALSGQKTVLGA